MAGSSHDVDSDKYDPSSMPFVAPCNKLDKMAPWRWLRMGWSDICIAPKQSLLYGFIMMLISYTVAYFAYKIGSFIMMVALLAGFMFIGPVLAFGLYSISRQIQDGRKPVLGYCLSEGKRHFGNEMVFAAILLVVFLIWARAASTIHIFFPAQANPDLGDLAIFLGVGSAVGAIFSAVIFCASAFSLPMLVDRKVDVVTAVVTSINATFRNKGIMLIWGSIIVTCVFVGFFTATLIILLPLIGHATWHAYQETINAEAWLKYKHSDKHRVAPSQPIDVTQQKPKMPHYNPLK